MLPWGAVWAKSAGVPEAVKVKTGSEVWQTKVVYLPGIWETVSQKKENLTTDASNILAEAD